MVRKTHIFENILKLLLRLESTKYTSEAELARALHLRDIFRKLGKTPPPTPPGIHLDTTEIHLGTTSKNVKYIQQLLDCHVWNGCICNKYHYISVLFGCISAYMKATRVVSVFEKLVEFSVKHC